MVSSSQPVAGKGVEHASAEKGGADQQIDDVQHDKGSCGAATGSPDGVTRRCPVQLLGRAYKFHAVRSGLQRAAERRIDAP
jgi:hypothetical protein